MVEIARQDLIDLHKHIALNNILIKVLLIQTMGLEEALKRLGYNEVDCIRLDHLTDEERKAYTLAHNKLTMNTDFDFDMLTEELASFETIDMSDFGFDIDVKLDEPKQVEEDNYEIPEGVAPKSKLGDIYQLGNHRLMCGDSTSSKDVKELMNGKLADLLFTDPPYNVNVSNSDGLTIQEAFKCASESPKEGGAFYVWHADSESKVCKSTYKGCGM